ncbi:reverse transcriptase domain-containing protein, partial [Tanacetum coccineum]
MGRDSLPALILEAMAKPLTPITAPWLFYKWGINIVGPFPERPGKVKFLIVAMDYFTKWIEAKATAIISGTQVNKFVWDNIVCRFGLSREIVSDNEKQFSGDPFKDWCKKLNTIQHFASVKYPQSNRLVERANRSLGEGIKARNIRLYAIMISVTASPDRCFIPHENESRRPRILLPR